MSTKQPSSNGDSAVFRFFLEIAAIAQASDKLMDRYLPHALKPAHFTLLDCLARHDGSQSMAELAHMMQANRGTVSRNVQQLEDRGLVSVVADETDGRSKSVRLKRTGRTVRDDALAALAPHMLELAKTISAPDMIEALPLLERIHHYMEAEAR